MHGCPALVGAIQTLAVRGAPLLGIAGGTGGAGGGPWLRRGGGSRSTGTCAAHRGEPRVRRAPGGGGLRGSGGKGAGEQAAAAAALTEARALHREDAQASGRMAEYGEALLEELMPGRGYQLLTHCNTGALVSGGEGTAFAVALRVHRQGRLRRLWVDETRPLLQGARLTAYEAARNGLAYSLLTDNAAGSLFAAGEVDAVLIGADRIAADGSVANKVGSYPLAVLAKYHHVPFIVVAPTTTVDLETPDGASIIVEQRSGREVTEITPSRSVPGGDRGGRALAPLGAPAYNPAFDVTPPELITAIVTEEGAISPVTGSDWPSCVPGHRR